MPILSFEVASYKPYRQPTRLQLRPLTVLIGKNHSGKSALMKALPLLAGSLASNSSRPLDLEASGLLHGFKNADLVSGRAPHGALELGLETSERGGVGSKTFRAKIQCLSGEPGQPDSAVVQDLLLRCPGLVFSLTRLENEYRLQYEHGGVSRSSSSSLLFEGLLPRSLPRAIEEPVSEILERELAQLRQLRDTVSYLVSPRSIQSGWMLRHDIPGGADPTPTGGHSPWLLADDDELLEQTRQWFEKNLSLQLQVLQQGPAIRTTVGSGFEDGEWVGLENAGQGLSQVLPIVVQRLHGLLRGEGVDLLEQPEAELHPAFHGAVADLFLSSLSPSRPALVETHSENFLLRIRRRIAEGQVDPDQVGIYWVDRHPEGGAGLREIQIDRRGDLDNWPDGVFYEDYYEVMAIRRAARMGHKGLPPTNFCVPPIS